MEEVSAIYIFSSPDEARATGPKALAFEDHVATSIDQDYWIGFHPLHVLSSKAFCILSRDQNPKKPRLQETLVYRCTSRANQAPQQGSNAMARGSLGLSVCLGLETKGTQTDFAQRITKHKNYKHVTSFLQVTATKQHTFVYARLLSFQRLRIPRRSILCPLLAYALACKP